MASLVTPLRRTLLVVTLYLIGAVALDGVLQRLVPLLVLPPLFLSLARGIFTLGLGLAIAIAWRYQPSDTE